MCGNEEEQEGSTGPRAGVLGGMRNMGEGISVIIELSRDRKPREKGRERGKEGEGEGREEGGRERSPNGALKVSSSNPLGPCL